MIGDPKALLLLLLLLPMAWISYSRYRRSVKGVVAVAGGAAGTTASLYMIRWFFGSLSFLLAFALGVVALADLQWGRTSPAERPAESETIFVVDISRSMLADDVTPSRLELSKAVMRNIVNRNRDGSFGIVLFKGAGFVYLPVTSDYTAISDHLDAVDPRIFSAPGTNLEAGLEVAVEAFPEVRDVRKNIVLFTDGDGLDGDPRQVSASIGKKNITLAIVGAGKPEPTDLVIEGNIVVDENGNSVRTALREDVLEAVRLASGGFVLNVDDGDIVQSLLSIIGGSGGLNQGQPRDRYRLFLGWGLVFLGIWVALRTVRWGKVF